MTQQQQEVATQQTEGKLQPLSDGCNLRAKAAAAAKAEAAAVKEVRDQAIIVAVGAARDIIASQMSAANGNSLIDDAIEQVGAKLH